MSESVKRYWLESYVDGFYKARQFVLASDHDRIVSALTAERNEADRRAGAAERHMAELKDSAFRRENWLRKAKEEAGYSASETFDRVWAETLGKANERDALRAEVERLQRELATAHADASHYASTAEDLRAEVERLKPLLKEAGEELSVK